MLVKATVGAGPSIAFALARSRVTPWMAAPLPATPSQRFSQPVTIDLSPGAARSMKSCASKCERDGSGLPQACRRASAPAWYAGSNGAKAGCRPKPSERASSVPGGTCIVGRLA